MLRKIKVRDQEERLRQEREQERDSRPPPTIPSHSPLPTINAFASHDDRPDSIAIISNKASNFSRPYHSPTMPSSTSMPLLSKQFVPQQHSSSMQDFSRDAQHSPISNGGYAGQYQVSNNPNDKHTSATSTAMSNLASPRRVRRRKDPTPFNVLVVGAKGSGKTSLVDFLKASLAVPPSKQHSSITTPKMTTTDGIFSSHYVESELDGERVGITLWDSQGLEKTMADLQIRELASFIESKFDETFMEESKVMRSPGARDTHIHCVFLVLDPGHLDANLRASKIHANGNAFAQARGPSGLSTDLDMQVMKGLAGKTTVIPIISKADTLSGPHMAYLKRSVWNSIQSEKLDPLDALGLEESDNEYEDEDNSESQSDHDALPIQSTTSSMSGDHKVGRLNDDSDFSDEHFEDHSPMAKTRSSMTTPSPAHVSKRQSSRLLSRSITPGDIPVEDMYIPFSLLSPDPYELEAVGRRFPWGLADPYNPDHCDFARLRESVFSEWRTELRSAAREKWYENWRSSRLARNPLRMRQTSGVTPVSAVPREGRVETDQRSLSPAAYSSSGLGLRSSPESSRIDTMPGKMEYSARVTPVAF